jgi:hypothetical protein
MAISYMVMKKAAKRLIGGNGAACKIKNPTQEYDPDTNEYIIAYEEFSGFCIITNYKDNLINGTSIKVGDRQVACVFEDVDVKPGISILDIYSKNGSLKYEYSVVNSSPVNPDGETLVVIKLQVR